MRWILAATVCTLLFSLAPRAETTGVTFRILVNAGNYPREGEPVRATVTVPRNLSAAGQVLLLNTAGRPVPAQLTRPSLLDATSPASLEREIHFLLPQLQAGTSTAFRATIQPGPAPAGEFAWHDEAEQYSELRLRDRPALRYMCAPLDNSSPEAREQTYKVFHHLFDPSGSFPVTKGAGGLYTHHRGLFFGFNRISYGDGVAADTWHCTGETHQSHEELVGREAGPVLARHRVGIDWRGPDRESFAWEVREMTLYDLPGGRLVEFASVLRSAVGPVRLDGDPQHAGFQFRAANEVAERSKDETYYLRPDGRGRPGETRNWPDHREHVDLPWNGMSFLLGDRRYTALYLDHPNNPKEARYSERDYGRFGSYFEYDLDTDRPLRLNYRVWLQEGELTTAEAARHSAAFAEPARLTVTPQ
jgi:hypothetical protein